METPMKLAGIWMFVGGIITLITPMILILDMRIDTVLGIVLVLVLILVCSFEIGAAKVVFRTEIGGWGAVIQALFFTLFARGLMIYISWNWYLYANVILGVGELGILIFLYRKKELFMPSEEEAEEIKKRMAGPTVKVSSECPNCHAIVEMNWVSCPYCGTKLIKHCGNCGEPLGEGVVICPKCGTTVSSMEALTKTIESLRISVEETESPETRALQYAKLAENLLKAGDNEGALEAYGEAIKSTEFARKRSYFRVKMAVVLKNTGRVDEALGMLDSAMRSDPEDYAEAGKIKRDILSPKTAGEAGSPQTS